MDNTTKIHNNAMDLAEEAMIAKINGDIDKFNELSDLAYQLERQVAEHFIDKYEDEPTRSVLLRSAASLALDCKQLREAERLVCSALYGNPPEEIADELRDLLDQIYFNRHMELRGMELGEDEMQFSIAGSAVAPGVSPIDLFVNRINSTEKLIYRTIARLADKPFADRGPSKQSLKKNYEIFMSPLKAASMAVTFKISFREEDQQLTLKGYHTPSEMIVDEVLNCMEFFSKSEENKLRQHISSDAYYRNFIGLAKMISPDGKKVNFVGFSARRNGKERKVGLTISGESIPIPEITSIIHKNRKPIWVVGELRFADSLDPTSGKIILTDHKKKKYTIIVPEGMMSDIVKPLWEEPVYVFGIQEGSKIYMEKIGKADDPD